MPETCGAVKLHAARRSREWDGDGRRAASQHPPNSYHMVDATTAVQSPRPAATSANEATEPAARAARPVVRLVSLPLLSDARGSLTFGETGQHLPFTPERYFAIFGVPAGEARGHHAHRRIDQFLVCLRGSCLVEAESGQGRETVRLEGATMGLHVPPRTWLVMRDFSEDAMLLVLASEPYEEAEYVRDYAEFQELVRS